jgi:hypothetical protein
MPAPNPNLPTVRPPAGTTTTGLDWWVEWGSYNGWAFGSGTPWDIHSVDGFPDMMALKTQDGQLVGDGQVFGWDSEEKRVITFEFGGAALWLEHCFPLDDGTNLRDRITRARCANLRRHDDLPLQINDQWVIMARPRRFLAPQRASEPPVLTVSYEAQDPAIYSSELQTGTAQMGVSEWGRPYRDPQDPGPDLIWQYRGWAGEWTPGPSDWPPGFAPQRPWRYMGRGRGGLLAVTNQGCRETWLQVRIQGPVSGPMLINQTTFERVAFDITLGASDWLDVDFRTGTVMLNGTSSRYWTITRDSVWFSCAPGTTFIRYLAAGEVTESTVTAWWRSAW